jgi:hypothetical protein
MLRVFNAKCWNVEKGPPVIRCVTGIGVVPVMFRVLEVESIP